MYLHELTAGNGCVLYPIAAREIVKIGARVHSLVKRSSHRGRQLDAFCRQAHRGRAILSIDHRNRHSDDDDNNHYCSYTSASKDEAATVFSCRFGDVHIDIANAFIRVMTWGCHLEMESCAYSSEARLANEINGTRAFIIIPGVLRHGGLLSLNAWKLSPTPRKIEMVTYTHSNEPDNRCLLEPAVHGVHKT